MAVTRVGMIAVHGADGALSHVAWKDQHTLLDKEDQFAKITVREQGAKVLQFCIG